MLITTRTILDHQVEIHVDNEGSFHANERGTTERIATGESLKQVLRLVRREYKKEQIRVAVPFTYVQGEKMYPALARGFHARNYRQILIWIDDGTENGKNDTLESWNTIRAVLAPNIPERDIRLIQKLFERRTKLKELTRECDGLIQKWEGDHTFNLVEATRQAVTEAAEAEKEEDDQPSPVSTAEDAEVDELLGEG